MQAGNKTYQEMRRDFLYKYKKFIVPLAKIYEKERRTKLLIAIFVVFICLVFIFLLSFFALFSLSFCCLCCLLVFFVIFSRKFYVSNKKEFENNIKLKIMPILCSAFENLSWRQEVYEKNNFLKESGLVEGFTKEYYDDIFYGSYKDVKFEIAEAKFTEIRDNAFLKLIGNIMKLELYYPNSEVDFDSSGLVESTLFKGVIVRLDTKENLKGRTIVVSNNSKNHPSMNSLKYVEFDNKEFEKKFDVYAEDVEEARRLITVQFMNKIKNLKLAFQVKDVRFAFYENNLFIALSTDKDLFSIGSFFSKAEDKTQFFQMFEEIISIIKLIDYFKLNN